MRSIAGAKLHLSALFVFLAGSSYGVMGTTYKLSYAAGFSWQDVMAAQAVFALLLFLALALLQMRRERWQKVEVKELLKLLGLGAITCCTTSLYCYALTEVPVPIALTILFQYTWLGIPVQALVDKKKPTRLEVISALVIVVGTVFASGILYVESGALPVVALGAALLAALSCTVFMTFSGRVGQNMPSSERGAIVCLGASVGALIITPSFISAGTVLSIAPHGILVGTFGAFLPVLLFGLGGSKLSPAATTVLASSELPIGLLVSSLVLGESVFVMQWVGVILILAGVLISQAQELFGGRMAYMRENLDSTSA